MAVHCGRVQCFWPGTRVSGMDIPAFSVHARGNIRAALFGLRLGFEQLFPLWQRVVEIVWHNEFAFTQTERTRPVAGLNRKNNRNGNVIPFQQDAFACLDLRKDSFGKGQFAGFDRMHCSDSL